MPRLARCASGVGLFSCDCDLLSDQLSRSQRRSLAHALRRWLAGGPVVWVRISMNCFVHACRLLAGGPVVWIRISMNRFVRASLLCGYHSASAYRRWPQGRREASAYEARARNHRLLRCRSPAVLFPLDIFLSRPWWLHLTCRRYRRNSSQAAPAPSVPMRLIRECLPEEMAARRSCRSRWSPCQARQPPADEVVRRQGFATIASNHRALTCFCQRHLNRQGGLARSCTPFQPFAFRLRRAP